MLPEQFQWSKEDRHISIGRLPASNLCSWKTCPQYPEDAGLSQTAEQGEVLTPKPDNVYVQEK